MANSVDFRVKNGLLVASTATFQSTVNATSTVTGALQVAGGVGIGRDLYVGGTIYGNGVISTATNIAGGTAGSIVYQSATGATGFINTGTPGSILQMGTVSTATFVSSSSVYVGFANLAATATSAATAYALANTSTTYVGFANIANQINTLAQTANTTYYPTFVDANNTTAAAESVYTTSSFTINPSTGYVGINTAAPISKLHVTEVDYTKPVLSLTNEHGAYSFGSYHSGSGIEGMTFQKSTGTTRLVIKSTDNSDTNIMFTGSGDRGEFVVRGDYNWYLNPNSIYGSGHIYLNSVSTGNVYISTSTGKVGIGTFTPASKLHVAGDARITGITTVTNTTNASSTTTGALTVAGGVGIGANAFIGGTATVLSTLASTTTLSANALYIAGGVGIAKSLVVTGEAIFQNNVIFSGTSTYVYSTNTVYTDNIINVHVPVGSTGSNHTWTVDDGKDIGFVFHNYKGADNDSFLGWANDSGYLEWYGSGLETVGGTFTNAVYGIFKTGGIILTNTTASNSTNTGALTVAGGVGIGGNLYVGGTLFGTVSGNITTATNLAGGIASQIPYQTAAGSTSFIANGTAGTILTSNGTSVPTWNNTLILSGTTAATSTQTGAFQVRGGAGIGGYVYAGGMRIISPNTNGNSSVDLPLDIQGAWLRIGDATTGFTQSGGVGIKLHDSGVQHWSLAMTGSNFVIAITGSSGDQLLPATRTDALFIDGSGNITGAANITATGDVAVNGGDLTSNQTTFNLLNSTVQTANLLGAGTAITVGATTGWTTIRNATTITNTTAATSTTTGALQVVGGVGIGGNLYVGGTIFGEASISGTITTATNLAGGVLGQIPYQSASGITRFIGTGTNGSILQMGANTATFVTTSSVYVGYANLAANATTATNAAVAYSTIAAHTAGTGLSGSTFNGSTAVTWTLNTATLMTTAVNLAGGNPGQFAYQTTAGTTAFISTGSMYVGRAVIADSAAGGSAQVNTVQQTANATYYPTFVDSNNAATAAELVYTTSSFVINPSTGNVGIGIASPSFKVDSTLGAVNGNTANYGYNIFADAAGNVGYSGYSLQLNNSTSNATGFVRLARTASTTYLGMEIQSQSRDGIRFLTSATTAVEVVRIDAVGNVGIGTSSPSAKLHVNTVAGTIAQFTGGTDSVVVFGSGGIVGLSDPAGTNGYLFRPSSNYAYVQTNGQERLRIDSTGSVGIGITNPASKLHVSGDARITGITTVTNTTAATSTNTGAFQVVGGVGIGGNLYVGGEIVAQKLTIEFTTVTTTLVTTDDVIKTTNNTNASSTATGALQITGGAGIGRDLYVGGNITVLGTINATVTGVITTATNLAGGSTGQFAYQTGAGATAFISTASMYVGRAVVADSASSSAQVNTVQQTANATYYPAFVDTNNAAATGELVYTTSSFTINPSNGNVVIQSTAGNQSPPTLKVTNGTAWVYALPALSSGSYNSLVQAGDQGLIFSSGTIDSSASAIVISPWASNTSGLRITSSTVMVSVATPYSGEKFTVNGGAYINGTVTATNFVGNITGTITGAATQVNTLAQTGNSTYYPTFVDSNNASSTGELVYTTSSFFVNPGTKVIGVGSSTVYTTFGYNSSYGYMRYDAVGSSFHYFTGAGLVSNQNFIGESNVYARGNLGNDGGPVLTVTGGTTTKTYINGILTVGSTATTSGEKLAVAGGVYVNGTVTATNFVGNITGTVTGAATQVNTVAQTANATYYPTFVPDNNAATAAELVYTTSSFSITPSTGVVRIASTVASTSTLTGALLVTGGAGIGGDVNIGGALNAISKSFVIPHPTKPNMKLRYGSLESPYHGVRLTGEATLTGKTCRVELPDYIRGLCKQEGAQVQITNIKHGKTIWVETVDVDNDYFEVSCERGFFDRKEYKFFWAFTAIRKDIEEIVVEFES